MKYLFLFTMLIAACQPAEVGEEPITPAEEQIAKDLIQGAFDELWAGADSTQISTYHTDDFLLLEQGEVWDNDRIKDYMRQQLARPDRPVRTNRMEYIAIEKYGPSLQIAYHNFAEFTRAETLVGRAQWLESALAVRTEAGWKLRMMHSTRVGD